MSNNRRDVVQPNGRKYNPREPIKLLFQWVNDFQRDGKKDEKRKRWFTDERKAKAHADKLVEEGVVKWVHIYDYRRPYGQDLMYKWTPIHQWNHDLEHFLPGR